MSGVLSETQGWNRAWWERAAAMQERNARGRGCTQRTLEEACVSSSWGNRQQGGGKHLGMNPGNKQRQSTVMEGEVKWGLSLETAWGEPCMGSGAVWLAQTVQVQPLQDGKAWLQLLGLGGAPLQLRVGLPPKSSWAWLCKFIYLTELPKPAVESPPTSVSKAFTPSKVSSEPTGGSREGWLGQEHSRLSSPAWGSFPSQWSNGKGVQPSNDSAHQGAKEQNRLHEVHVSLLWL